MLEVRSYINAETPAVNKPTPKPGTSKPKPTSSKATKEGWDGKTYNQSECIGI